MLNITKDQMAKTSVSLLNTFKVQLKDHIRIYFPIQCENLDDSSLFTFINENLEVAKKHSINEQAAIQSFIDHTVLLGRNFYINPLYSELCIPLYDKDISDNIY